MALRDQPYLPLYVQDYMTDEKLAECSAKANGVFIRIMCVMHKSEPYGKILLKQKDKQNKSNSLNFANKLSKHMPFSVQDISESIQELIDEGVLISEGDALIQKRMVKDFELSCIRSAAGKSSATKRNFVITKPSTKEPTSSDIDNEYENIDKGGYGGNLPIVAEIDIYMQECLKDELHFISPLIQEQGHNGLTIVNLPRYLLEFNTHLKSTTDTSKSRVEYRTHFKNWLRKQGKMKDDFKSEYQKLIEKKK